MSKFSVWVGQANLDAWGSVFKRDLFEISNEWGRVDFCNDAKVHKIWFSKTLGFLKQLSKRGVKKTFFTSLLCEKKRKRSIFFLQDVYHFLSFHVDAIAI